MRKVPGVKGKTRNDESRLRKGTRKHVSHQESPRLVAVSEDKAKYIGKKREPVALDKGQIVGDADAVVNQSPPERAIKPGDPSRIMELDKVVRDVAAIVECQYRSGRRRRCNRNRSSTRQRMDLSAMLDSGSIPGLRM